MTLKDHINSALNSDQQSEKYYDRGTGLGCVFRYQLDTDSFKPSLSKYKVVCGTFLHQDLFAPNPAYNLTPYDPNFKKKDMDELFQYGVPAIGTLAYEPSKVKFLFSGHKSYDLQDPKLNRLVLYSHDSNSCDMRAVYVKDKPAQKDKNKDGWQGPCIWIQEDKTPQFSSNTIGAGAWPMGNPHDNPPLLKGDGNGGGTGFHCKYNVEDAETAKTNYKCAVSTIDIPGKEQYVDEYEWFKYSDYNINHMKRLRDFFISSAPATCILVNYD